MTKKKTTHHEGVDLEAMEAERVEMESRLADLRAGLPAAEQAVEEARDAELDLQAALAAGDDTITAEQMVTARAEVSRVETILSGLRGRIHNIERSLARRMVPRVAVLAADILNGHDLAGLIRWQAVTSPTEGRRILDAGRDNGERVGVISEDRTEPSPFSPSIVSEATLSIKAVGDPLMRGFTTSEIENALTSTRRIKFVRQDRVAQRDHDYRVKVSGIYVDAIPVIDIARAKFAGPDASRTMGVSQNVLEWEKRAVRDLGNGVHEVDVTGKVAVTHHESFHYSGWLGTYLDRVNAEGSPDRPAYGPLGLCVASTARSTGGRDGQVIVEVEQTFRHRLTR